MAGNRAIYDRAMERSREATRSKQWDQALKSAGQALQEFPDDIDARTAAAVALFHTQRLPQALKMFEDLRTTDTDNTFFIDYIARCQEAMGHTADAVETYGMLADMHEHQRMAARTIDALRDVLRLNPQLEQQRQRLAQLLKDTGSVAAAGEQYLILAQQFYQQRRLDDAANYAEAALNINPESREAKEVMGAIHQAMANAAEEPGTVIGDSHEGETSQDLRSALSGMTGSLRSQQFVLEKMFRLANEKQEAGDVDGAIEQYELVLESGLERADVYYSLGLLYQERNNHQAAVNMLSRSSADPEYALSSHYGLGRSYTELDQLPQAAQEYEQAIGMIDLETVGRAESEDLIDMYELVGDIYQKIGNLARAASLYSTLASFLQTKRWGKETAAKFQQRATELRDRNMMSKLRSLGTGALVPQPELPPSTAPAPSVHPDVETMPEIWGKIRPITDFTDRDISTSQLTMPQMPVQDIDPLAMLESIAAPETPTHKPMTSWM